MMDIVERLRESMRASDICNEAADEIERLRAFKAACEKQEAVAVVTDVYSLVWYGSGPIAPIVRRMSKDHLVLSSLKLIRRPLPKTRRWKFLRKLLLRNRAGVLTVFHPYRPEFKVWRQHSRWVWWKFYRD